VIHKVLAVCALVGSSLAMSISVTPVHAAVVTNEPELIAHAVVAPTSPQTYGPSGLAAPYNAVPWGLDRIDQRGNALDNSFSFSGNGAGVKVYVVDSGVNATHVEFASSRVVDGWSYRADNTPSIGSYRNSNESYHSARTNGTISACAYNPTLQQNNPSTFDDLVNASGADITDKGKLDNDGHGTHVAGTIGGEVTGIAKGVTIVPVRVLDSCGAGTTSMVHNGLQWILANHLAGEKAVVNMSIGFDASAKSIDSDITALLAEGVVVVAAAGNDGGSSCNTTPAGTPGTISVGAIDRSSKEAYYSNFGDCVDIFAPGSEVLSAWPKNGSTLNNSTYYLETGTSMAAPHVSGVAALLLVGRTITSTTPSEIWALLKNSSTCDVVTYYDTTRGDAAQTSNRILNNGSAAGPACKPSSVTATVASHSTALTWTEPASPNGSAVTGYTATLSPGGATCSTNASTLTCTISGLTNSTTYTASVRATNAIGTSALAATTTVTPIGVPSPVMNLVTGIANNSLVMSWSQQAGEGPGITYVATATPGGASCSTTSTACTISGLTNGVLYSVSVVGTNSLGAASAVTATATPDGEPEAPTSIATSMASRSITLSWPAITTTLGVTYKVTASPGGASCTTTTTTCTVLGLKNGTDYTFTVITIAPSGKISPSSVLKARPGFTVKATTVNRKSRTTLSKIVSAESKGKKTWSESGLCSIVSGKLVAPAKKATCKVTLKVAKSGGYPAMSTTVSVSVK